MNSSTIKHSPTAPFHLSKWYLDCISENGEAVIGYAASLRWKALTLRYASILKHAIGKPAETRSTLRDARPPVSSPERFTWDCPALGVQGTWQPAADPFERTVYEEPSGRIHWSCLQPRSLAEIVFPSEGGRKITGVGYLEHLEMTLPPWRLPIAELRWGRFHSATDALVWIDWRGEFSTRLVFVNGEAVTVATIDDGMIDLDGLNGRRGRLVFEDRCVLREGPLVRTALAGIPRVRDLLPLRILRTQEQKWLSQAALIDSETRHDGWAIHEVVRWPGASSLVSNRESCTSDFGLLG